MVAILLLIPTTARLAVGLIVVWMTAVILSHIFVLGYGWFFVDALMLMLLAVIYLLLTRRHSHRGRIRKCGDDGCFMKAQEIAGEQLEAETQWGRGKT